VSWAQHVAWLDAHWQPGEHCSIIAATGDGKSHLIRCILEAVWKDARVVVIDPTEDDRNFGHPAFRTVTKHPTKLQMTVHNKPLWYRTVPASGRAGREPVQSVMSGARKDREWVIVVDEVRKVTDARDPCYGLAAEYEENMLRARKRDVTMISATQAPRWVPSCFYDQPKYLYLGRIRDRRARIRLEEISGADADDVIGGINQLKQFEFLFVAPDDYMVIVHAPAKHTEA
jgi:hypothetical protein